MDGAWLFRNIIGELEKTVELINGLYNDDLIQDNDEAYYLKRDIEYDLETIRYLENEFIEALNGIEVDYGKEE